MVGKKKEDKNNEVKNKITKRGKIRRSSKNKEEKERKVEGEI